MRYWLKELRERVGLTQLNVSKKCNITQGYYADIENGKRTPYVGNAKKIASFLGFSWQRFYENIGEPTNEERRLDTHGKKKIYRE